MDRFSPSRRLLLLSGAFALPIPRLARAQDLVVRSNALTAQANSGTVGVIAGGVDGTYIRIAADLAAVLDDGVRLRVIPIIGKGSLQNLSDIMFLRGIDIGIVQSDVLAFAQRQRLFPALEQVHYIAKLYDEEVHLLAGRDVRRVEDLANRPVNVDVRGSGTAMTAAVLFESLGIPVQMVNDVQDTALGEAAPRGNRRHGLCRGQAGTPFHGHPARIEPAFRDPADVSGAARHLPAGGIGRRAVSHAGP